MSVFTTKHYLLFCFAAKDASKTNEGTLLEELASHEDYITIIRTSNDTKINGAKQKIKSKKEPVLCYNHELDWEL